MVAVGPRHRQFDFVMGQFDHSLSTRNRVTAFAVLAIALIAVVLAAWSLLRPLNPSTAPVTDQQVADAKARACTAYTTVRSAVSLQTHADLGSEPVAVEAVAANARLSMAAGGSYLLARLDPATRRPWRRRSAPSPTICRTSR